MKPENKGKLRIAMLGHKRIPSREGGVEIVVEQLATKMSACNYNVTCYNRKGHHVSGKEFDSEKLREYKGIRIKSVFTIEKGGLAAMSSSFFAAFCAAFGRYDVVHFHAEGPCAMLWLPKLFGKKCVATIHGLDHMRAKWGRLASFYIRFGEKCAVKFADEIIVLSHNLQNYFKENYNRETVYIPNGVIRPQKKQADIIHRLFGLEKDGYILFLGRLVPEKGIKYLIEAFKQVDTTKKLVIAGGASGSVGFANEIKALADDDKRIIFTDFVEGDCLSELYSNAYIYVLPSDLEGMPLSLLEAMSYGNCCLTSDLPECVEVTADHGFAFRQGDVDALKNKLQFLCDNSSVVDDLKEKTADYICNKYNWDNVVRETLKLYGVTEDELSEYFAAKEVKYENLAHK